MHCEASALLEEYNAKIAPRIRAQYETAPQVPCDDWCAWLELAAVKLMTLVQE